MQQQSNASPQVAVVTGAGRGLGREMALQLAACGLHVAALGRNKKDLDELAAEAVSGKILALQVDVADTNALHATFNRIDTELGSPDILVNNAAVYPHRDFLEETPESFRQVLEINLGGMVTCAILALERMVEHGQGRIINVATFAGSRPAPLASAYSVSKGACRILTQAIVEDLKDRFPDIVITDWVPGALNTQMGIPDGIAPETAAQWGVALALWRDPDLNGATFVQDQEHLSTLSLKRRLLNKLTGRAKAPRRILPTSRT
ncbi:SDR family NAD(P)-dependent oxidoreductase [Primorskyibacter flagellatus]|uniref:3-oxoacyl-[acyl-carrier protein] reductase n=1 Tax=Primorskyibacter flagellatus TaxID=1387277 RepID=A0A1W2DZV7_9RHOB|nr:SDR family oxidoreductase [Primorskyibacter flagellatus]SMD03054.1 3-oxoacyl-[acyl-carrier protein] reductase [Primorskyibacter flagellatus]